jgi:hypothetical protein
MRTPLPLAKSAIACLGLALALGSTGCSKLVMMRPEHDPTRGELAARPMGLEVEGYITFDGEYHAFRGWATARDDSVRFYALQHQPGSPPQATLPREQVKAIFSRRLDTAATWGGVGVFLVGVGVAFGVVLMYVIASLGA